MKNLLLSVIFLGIAAYVGVELYERGNDYDWTGAPIPSIPLKEQDAGPFERNQEEETKLSLPAEMRIESVDGRKINVTVIAQNHSHIQFKRSVDAEEFIYPLSKLTTKTRKKLKSYIISGLKNAGKYVKSGELTLADAHVEQIKEEIAKIDRRLETLRIQFEKSLSKVEQRTLYREAERLAAKKQEFELKIAEREI